MEYFLRAKVILVSGSLQIFKDVDTPSKRVKKKLQNGTLKMFSFDENAYFLFYFGGNKCWHQKESEGRE